MREFARGFIPSRGRPCILQNWSGEIANKDGIEADGRAEQSCAPVCFVGLKVYRGYLNELRATAPPIKSTRSDADHRDKPSLLLSRILCWRLHLCPCSG